MNICAASPFNRSIAVPTLQQEATLDAMLLLKELQMWSPSCAMSHGQYKTMACCTIARFDRERLCDKRFSTSPSQAYAQTVQEFKDSAGLEETSVGYVVAGHLGGGPKSPQYGLLKKGTLDDKEAKKLNKCPSVSGLLAATQSPERQLCICALWQSAKRVC